MKIEIISPEKTIFFDDAKALFIPSVEGGMEILENHAPSIIMLEKGNIKIEKEKPMNILIFNRGYAHITKEKTTILLEDF